MNRPFDLSDKFFDFIVDNSNSDALELIMKHTSEEMGFDVKFAAIQIISRKKTRHKLSDFLNNPRFLFPDSISAEQASDQRVANFHARIIGTSKRVVDLTSGLGVDAMAIAKNGNKVKAIEIDLNKASFLNYNKSIMKIDGFEVINSDSNKWLESTNDSPDFFFIDPARRTNDNSRTYSFKDCAPDITLFYKQLIERGSELLIKSSPLLDIDAILNEFNFIDSIYIVSVKGENKEVLIHLSPKVNREPKIRAVDLNDNGVNWTFTLSIPYNKKISEYADSESLSTGQYLYEPGAALMKLHAGFELCDRFKELKKVSPNTELFISKSLYPDFPGRIVEISEILSKKDLKKLKCERYNVVVRNYPMGAQALKNKLGVLEHNTDFIYGFRIGKKERPILIAGKKIERH